jgi:hypothetical protein
MSMPDTLFTFQYLSTLAGASLLTYLIVQYTKSYIDSIKKFSTDLYAVLVGTVILLLAQIAQGANALDWRIYVLCLFNGFLVAVTSGKINDVAIKPPASNQQKDNNN